LDFIHREGNYENEPFSVTELAKKLVIGIVCFAIYMYIAGIFDSTVLGAYEFTTFPLWWKAIYIYGVVCIRKYQIYAFWMYGEAANICSGIAYSGDGNFNNIKATDIIGVEIPESPRSITNSWNKQTNEFLIRYIYIRVMNGNKNRQPLATLAVFFTSAYWHGFYPCYYITFLSFFFVLAVSRSIYKCSPLLTFLPSIIKRFLSISLTITFIYYFSSIYHLTDTTLMYNFLKNTYFVPHILVLSAFGLSLVVPLPKTDKQKDKSKVKED
jgi:lysophospholipid acyltransferase